MRLQVPAGFCEWWDERFTTDDQLSVTVTWRGGQRLELGQLRSSRQLLQLSDSLASEKSGGEKLGRTLAKAFARAGWGRPALDPSVLLQLVALRESGRRVEFILDTNALVEGIAHWLVDHFADRCDLVITPVTLRELQDAHEQAKFTKSERERSSAEAVAMRQLYLAAHRFRERSGYPRVIWRELDVEDTALLLSRGNTKLGAKTSESDTLLLRAVRRSIHDRVHNLERYFVTGDTALARRAATELPSGSLIAARVQPVLAGEVLFPRSWWPGPNEGLRVVRHPARLVWELLCVGDHVELKDASGNICTFCAFADPMWPSDYLEPWVQVDEALTVSTSSTPSGRVNSASAEASGSAPSSAVPSEIAKSSGSETSEPIARVDGLRVSKDDSRSPGLVDGFWPPWSRVNPSLADNLRIPAKAMLDLVAAIATSSDAIVQIPSAVYETSAKPGQVRTFVESLGLGSADKPATHITPDPAVRHRLQDIWSHNDRDGVFDLLRTWIPLDEWATLEDPPERPENTKTSARALAALLGQGFYDRNKRWVRGGLRPEVATMRDAVLKVMREPARQQPTISILELLTDVFAVRLGVAPARVVGRWRDLWDAGVFAGFEAREGGSSSGKQVQDVAVLRHDGWAQERLDLESIEGVRDLVYTEGR